MIGDNFSCNPFFKEERFNGWSIGEIHVLDPELIANARRDDFEKNDAYYSLVENIKEWAAQKTKGIRKLSYDRSLSNEKKAVMEAENVDDVNDLMLEEDLGDVGTESDYIDYGESEGVAETDYIGKLSSLFNQKKQQTKYRALNINQRLTIDQRKVLERVFDIVVEELGTKKAESIINLISERF